MPGLALGICFCAAPDMWRLIVADGAFSGKVGTGFPEENATKYEQLERFPNRKALQRNVVTLNGPSFMVRTNNSVGGNECCAPPRSANVLCWQRC
jgi:hypothetical protein